ncbi:MAG: AMIN domain-containing protein [Cyanobacteria bacterium J06627_8]
MKSHLGLAGIIGSCAASVLVSQVALAAGTEIRSVQVSESGTGIVVTLESANGEERPQIFTVSRGNTLVADMVNTSLSLPDGDAFLQENPAPGIDAISVTQLDENSVRITVSGAEGAPVGQVQQDDGLIVFNFSAGGSSADVAEPPPQLEATEPIQAPEPIVVPEPEAEISQAPTVPPLPDDTDILVPDPTVRIDGNQVSRQLIRPSVPPTQPRAVAPPVGDIATSILNATPPSLDIGTREVVPRLVLRDAPAREVLSLLARAAGLNLAYVDPLQQTDVFDRSSGNVDDDTEVRVSLDIENEPIEDVFNYVLRITGLEANRIGRTIFVSPRLPDSARNTVAVTIRLNQADATNAATYLATLGAETRQFIEGQFSRVTERDPGTGLLNTVETFREPQVVTVEVDPGTSPVLINGLSATSDPRLNTVTLVGPPNSVQLAIELLTQLDARLRQVAVNLRILDVDLDAIEQFSSSFSFGIDDTRIINSNGVGLINFDEDSPAETSITTQTIGTSVAGDFTLEESDVIDGAIDIVREDVDFPDNDAFAFTSDFLAQLQFAVTSGSAKILTDPTLVVQEGQTAELILADEVITNVEIETEGTGDDRTQTVTVERSNAGVTVSVQVQRIDDNGFVTLAVNPTVSAPSGTSDITVEGFSTELTLLSTRQLSSGNIRVRDGQTLILSGIIQDTDLVSVTKFPILGDLPIIGALFRRTSRTNERREVIILMTTDILDDSELSTFGYSYNGLSPDSQQLLRE